MRSMRIDCGPVRIASWRELSELHERQRGGGRPDHGAPARAPPSAAPRASRGLGLAFQLTNFIRDVREDFALDRIYLPLEDRARFGVGEEEIAQGEATPGFQAMLALQVERARELFDEGAPALAAVEPRVRPGMRMACGVYLRVLDRVERLGYDVLGRRAGLPPWELGLTA